MGTARSRAAIFALLLSGCAGDALLGALGEDGGSGGGSGESGSTADLPPWTPQQGSWAEVSLNTVSDMNPCPDDECAWSGIAGQRGVLDSWNGGALATTQGARGTLLAWGGGGNSGYYGNEVYGYDIETRLWSRRTEPVRDPVVANPELGEFEDGSPVAAQNNDLLDFHPPTDSFVILTGSGTLSGAWVGTGHMLELPGTTWRRTAELPLGSHLGASAYDPNREIYWINTQGGDLFSYDPVGGPDSMGRHGSVNNYGHVMSIQIYTVAAVEPRHDVFVLFDGSGGQLLGVDLGAPGQPIDLRSRGEAPSVGGGGFEWVGELGSFYWYRGHGNDIRTLTPPDSGEDWRTGEWTWAPVEVLGGPPPQERTTPVFGSWRWAPAISSFVICTGVERPVHAFRP